MKMLVRRHALQACESQVLRTSYGTLREREVLAVSLTDDDGVTGYGEAAPLEPYDGVSIWRAWKRRWSATGPVLEAATGMNGAEIVDACRRADDLPAALAAIDLALWDRAGRRAGRAVASLISDTPALTVPVNATLSALDRAGAAQQAAAPSRRASAA